MAADTEAEEEAVNAAEQAATEEEGRAVTTTITLEFECHFQLYIIKIPIK